MRYAPTPSLLTSDCLCVTVGTLERRTGLAHEEGMKAVTCAGLCHKRFGGRVWSKPARSNSISLFLISFPSRCWPLPPSCSSGAENWSRRPWHLAVDLADKIARK